jgi:hypothetical protein
MRIERTAANGLAMLRTDEFYSGAGVNPSDPGESLSAETENGPETNEFPAKWNERWIAQMDCPFTGQVCSARDSIRKVW